MEDGISGVGEYTYYKFEETAGRYTGDTEEKLIAYAPLHLGQELWSIGVWAPKEDARKLIRSAYLGQLSLAGLIILIILGSSAYALVVSARFGRMLEKEVETKTRELKEYITDLKRAEESLRKSEEKYRTLFEAESDTIFLVDEPTADIIEANKAAVTMYGYSYEELLQLKAMDLSAEPEKTRQSIVLAGKTRVPLRYHKKKDGAVFPVEITAGNFKLQGRKINISTIRDITERVRAEEQIKASLKEKTVLLQELYHRTRNIMNVIRSMLTLQASYIEDEQTLSILAKTENRINAMALVHEKLYQAQDLSNINLKEYIGDLTNLLLESYRVSPDKISLILDVDNILVLFDIAIPCGMILNELISNSLKHAFPGEMKGEIRVRLTKRAEEIEFQVSDNGVGVPDGFDFRNSDTLGFRVIVSAAEHELQGEVEFEANNGVSCRVKFKEDALYTERV